MTSRTQLLDRAEKIFWSLRKLPPSDWARELEDQCGRDAELHGLVRDLLQADSLDLSSFLAPVEVDVRPLDATEELRGELGPYRLIGLIGRGGMGAVYEAEDPRLGRRIAIKVFPQDLAPAGDVFDRIEHEARLLAKLNHPFIATVHSLEVEDSRPFFTQELVPGETLFERVRRKPLSIEETLRLGADTAEALAHAHEVGVIHRDLKPENIKLCPDGSTRILDFGVSALIADGAVTSPGRFGTPGYLSPEQLEGANPRFTDDLWALGCLLHFALAGRSPVPGETVAEVMAATRESRLDWSSLPSTVPEDLRAMLEGLLRKEPALRGRTQDIALALRRWSDEVAALGSPTSGTEVPNNLRRRDTPFIGRSNDLAALADAFRSASTLSLVGFAGAGKTRLAEEYARRHLEDFAAGVWFVDLTELTPRTETSAEPVFALLAAALGIREDGGQDWKAAIADRLGGGEQLDRPSLLILDNCEHLLPAVRTFVENILDVCPALRLLCTTRMPLGLEGERIFQLDLLSIPESTETQSPEQLAHFDAVRLFVERVRRVRPEFALRHETAEVVLDICRRVQGIPLALELAAARHRVLSLHDIRDRLVDQLSLLRRGAEDERRHDSLRATLAWSYDLLSPDERMLLRRLTVFRGGWTHRLLEAVCADAHLPKDRITEVLESLLDHHLVYPSSSDDVGARHALLEVIREFAADQLEEFEAIRLREAHRRACLDLADEGRAKLGTPEGALWQRRLQAESANFRQALEDLSRKTADDSSQRLVAALGMFWHYAGAFSEGRRFCQLALELEAGSTATEVRCDLEYWAGYLSLGLGNLGEARGHFEAAVLRARTGGLPRHEALALRGVGNAAQPLGDDDTALESYRRAIEIFREIEDYTGLASALSGFGMISYKQGDLDEAESSLLEALEWTRKDEYRAGEASLLSNLGGIAFRKEQWDRAERRYRQALEIADDLGYHNGALAAHVNIAATLQRRGEPGGARDELIEALQALEESGNRMYAVDTFFALASVELDLGHAETSATLCAAAGSIREELGYKPDPESSREADSLARRAQGLLAPEVFDDCVAEGRSLDFKRALEFARNSTRSS